jgi:hypothetical protein
LLKLWNAKLILVKKEPANRKSVPSDAGGEGCVTTPASRRSMTPAPDSSGLLTTAPDSSGRFATALGSDAATTQGDSTLFHPWAHDTPANAPFRIGPHCLNEPDTSSWVPTAQNTWAAAPLWNQKSHLPPVSSAADRLELPSAGSEATADICLM